MARFATFCVVITCLVGIEAVQNKAKPLVRVKEEQTKMKKDIAKIKEFIEGGECGRSNVHFFFHDGADHNHHGHGEDETHVHVDLHLLQGAYYGDGDPHDHAHVSVCEFDKGSAYIYQDVRDKYAIVKFSFEDIDSDSLTINVHKNGDIKKGCSGLGDKYGPKKDKTNASQIGVIRRDQDYSNIWFNDTKVSIIGERSITGRSLVATDEDGKEVACCVIGRGADDHDHGDHDYQHGHGHGAHGHKH